MYDDNFSPEQIERLPDALPPEDALLVRDLQAVYQPLADSHTRSLERVRARLAQQEALGRTSLPVQGKQLEGKIIRIKEKKVMEAKNARGIISSTPLRQAKKRSPMMRTVGISIVAAVAVITILSFTIFSNVLHSAATTANKRSNTTSTGAPAPSQQQNAISHGTLACSFSAGPEVMLTNLPWLPQIAWSSQGEIAATNYASVRAYSAKNCASATLSQSSIQRTFGASWSPDGKKLLVGDVSDNSAYVLNSQGNIIAHLNNVMVAGSFWSSDSTKITIASIGPSQSLNLINSVDLDNGGKITTLATFPKYSNIAQLSPDGKLAIIEQADMTQKTKALLPSIWDVTSGKKIRDIVSAFTGNGINARFSPDGSLIAMSVPGAIQIYTKDWHLLTSIADTSSADVVHTLVWSPNGKYLAENADTIKIYNIDAKKLVTTFGAVDANHQIVSLAWAPDNTGIASATIVLAGGVPDDNTVNVWKLR